MARPRLVDVRASWCEACVRLETTTLRDPRVRARLGEMVVEVIDVSAADAAADRVMTTYQVGELPALRVLNPAGRVVRRLDGFVEPDRLLDALLSVSPLPPPSAPEP